MTKKASQEQQETRPGAVPAGEAKDQSVISGLTGGTADRSVTLSGRCSECGYLLGSDSCKISCG